jgi:hypothetical protein
MPSDEPLTVHSVLLVQDIRQEITGLQTLVGVLPSRLAVQVIPLILPSIQCRIEFSLDPKSRKTSYTFEVLSPSGNVLFRSDLEFPIPETGGGIAAIAWSPAVFAETGSYAFKLGPKGEELRNIHSLDLSVAKPPQPH